MCACVCVVELRRNEKRSVAQHTFHIPPEARWERGCRGFGGSRVGVNLLFVQVVMQLWSASARACARVWCVWERMGKSEIARLVALNSCCNVHPVQMRTHTHTHTRARARTHSRDKTIACRTLCPLFACNLPLHNTVTKTQAVGCSIWPNKKQGALLARLWCGCQC
jgi:hypothetical protein